MIREYIRNDATIILAVVPANVDIATTEALQMAREVDREGKRTLGESLQLQTYTISFIIIIIMHFTMFTFLL